MLDWLMILTFPLVSFIVTFILTPRIIQKSQIRGFLGVDVHKVDKPQIPVTGGLTIFSGFLGALTFTGLFNLNQTVMLAILLSSCLGAIIGLVLPVLFYGLLSILAMMVATGHPLSRPLESDRMPLLALAINLIPLRLYFVNYKFDKTGRGVLFVTFLLGMAFFIYIRYF